MPGNFRNQDKSGPLSGMVKVTVRDVSGLIRNLNAKNKQYVAGAIEVTQAYGEEFYRRMYEKTPVDLGNMRDLLFLRFTPQKTGFEVGWDSVDFWNAELRWYVPYVLLGTSRMPARPIHTEVDAIIRPRHAAALKQMLNDVTNRA